ncbi:MAG: hypothetical protein LC797_07960, partial [Chloroflexi bacterium]|nr:hypothetical protein [Chloroflexota bacterium]
ARAAQPFSEWTLCNAGLHARLLLCLASSPAFADDQTLFAAGPDVGVIASTDGGRTWNTRLNAPDEAQVFAVAVAPDASLFAATHAGVYRSADQGATWKRLNGATAATSVMAGPRRRDDSWPLLVVSMERELLVSDDQGASWRTLSDSFGAEVVSATIAPDGTLFAATGKNDELTLWRSVTAGVQWQRYLVERAESAVALAVSPNYGIDQRVYVGVGSRVLTPVPHTREVRSGEDRPLWRRVDLGATVAALSTPADPAYGHMVYAATSAGVHGSRDGAEHFSAEVDGEAPAAMLALAVSPNFAQDRLVYALELGGTLWRREDATLR